MSGERAKHYGCHIAFGCYARDKDWPNHVINMSVIMGSDGDIGLIGTTVYDVLDRYVEMYGWDATLPVARTEIGNIAMTAVGLEPMLYQALGLKGAEILILTVTGGSNAESAVQAAGARDEGTVIVDPRGTTLRSSANHHEDIVSARIPIGDFHKTRQIAEYPMTLLKRRMIRK